MRDMFETGLAMCLKDVTESRSIRYDAGVRYRVICTKRLDCVPVAVVSASNLLLYDCLASDKTIPLFF
jgi:hypothetical protein